MRNPLAAALALTSLVLATPALAQTYGYGEPPPMNRFTFNIGAGPSWVVGDASDVFDTGGAFQIGGGYRFHPQLSAQLQYFYSAYDVDQDLFRDTDLEADHTMQYGDVEVVFETLPKGPLGVYVLAGPGLYYRVVSVREFTGTAVVPYCDPWLYFCSATAVDTSRVIGTRDQWNFGLAGGVGVQFRLSPYAGFFVEGRYHYVWGDDFEDAEGDERSSDTQYIPVMAGFRF